MPDLTREEVVPSTSLFPTRFDIVQSPCGWHVVFEHNLCQDDASGSSGVVIDAVQAAHAGAPSGVQYLASTAKAHFSPVLNEY
jgi:hypothetical protein